MSKSADETLGQGAVRSRERELIKALEERRETADLLEPLAWGSKERTVDERETTLDVVKSTLVPCKSTREHRVGVESVDSKKASE